MGLQQRRATFTAEGRGPGIAVPGVTGPAFGSGLTREGQMSFYGLGHQSILPRRFQ
jgi:hypothetical protein